MKPLKLLIALLCFLTNEQARAQQAQGLYLELLGSAFGYSVNYDTRFNTVDDTGLGTRIGLFFAPDGDENYICIPLHINYILGEGRRKLELGLGLSAFVTDSPITRSQNIFPSGAIMYRWQPPETGFLFRIGLAPIFIPDERVDGQSDGFPPAVFWLWPGVSFGYKF